mmetsp:Transcript_18135/g.23866  ORF Transcript_18135/g.23866 Transcript_18135/m.23866 type:complete len:276 (-) Transcript_18135:212-1039(-)|eukprot:CAMPEP_0117753900 /NCGR_PEP_ID=MMETSP0947-20121206/12514_1 /TAXON_ID=44440 /ORGANISM="Chattonella subsalsa, Strain CCMP2191" /LENGTH=275 /DNA_ID=CAMNT_0005572897 /DNA_START=66 /DNA_END=893 /DNA_ORIENTATION=-
MAELDSEDSDFEIQGSGDDKESEDEGDKVVITAPENSARKRKVDEIWDQMNRDTVNYIQEKMKLAKKERTTLTAGRKRKVKRILSVLFGQAVAKQIIFNITRTSNKQIGQKAEGSLEKEAVPEQPRRKRQRTTESALSAEEKTNLIKAAAQVKKVQVSEVVNFAGKATEVRRTMTAMDANATQQPRSENSKAKASGVDKVLAGLQEPKKISTITKSSVDWENFKEEEGVSDELQKATKDGYLVKQDFLQRCDERLFETEKDFRTQIRNKQAKTDN